MYKSLFSTIYNIAPQLGRVGGYVTGPGLLQLIDRTEAPRNAYRLDTGMTGGEHVDPRIAYVNAIGRREARVGEDDVDDCGVGLFGNALALPIDSGKLDGGEILGYEMAGGLVVFVGCHCYGNTCRLQAFQQMDDAVVRAGIYIAMGIV